jgi:predicted outer membrane protein
MRHVTTSLMTAALAALLACPVAVLAQQPVQPQQPGQAQPAQPGRVQPAQPQQPGQPQIRGQAQQQSQQAQLSDSDIAAALILANRKEIAISEMAAEKAENDQVKEFAKKMVQDHQQLAQELQRFTQTAGISAEQLTLDSGEAGDRGQSAQDRRQADSADPQRPQDRTTRQAARPELNRSATAGQGGVEFVQLTQELAEESLQSIKKDLAEKSGKEFDQCYMFGQVMGHMHMADTLKVVSNHASPQLKQTVEKGHQKTKEHLEEAKKLTKEIDSDREES